VDPLQLATLLAQGSFGGGFGAGFGGGLAAGIGAGMVIFGGAENKFQRQLTAAIEAGEISIVDKNGESVTVESLLKLLQEQFKKA